MSSWSESGEAIEQKARLGRDGTTLVFDWKLSFCLAIPPGAVQFKRLGTAKEMQDDLD
jgi:hypothetical protein